MFAIVNVFYYMHLRSYTFGIKKIYEIRLVHAPIQVQVQKDAQTGC